MQEAKYTNITNDHCFLRSDWWVTFDLVAFHSLALCPSSIHIGVVDPLPLMACLLPSPVAGRLTPPHLTRTSPHSSVVTAPAAAAASLLWYRTASPLSSPLPLSPALSLAMSHSHSARLVAQLSRPLVNTTIRGSSSSGLTSAVSHSSLPSSLSSSALRSFSSFSSPSSSSLSCVSWSAPSAAAARHFLHARHSLGRGCPACRVFSTSTVVVDTKLEDEGSDADFKVNTPTSTTRPTTQHTHTVIQAITSPHRASPQPIPRSVSPCHDVVSFH